MTGMTQSYYRVGAILGRGKESLKECGEIKYSKVLMPSTERREAQAVSLKAAGPRPNRMEPMDGG